MIPPPTSLARITARQINSSNNFPRPWDKIWRPKSTSHGSTALLPQLNYLVALDDLTQLNDLNKAYPDLAEQCHGLIPRSGYST